MVIKMGSITPQIDTRPTVLLVESDTQVIDHARRLALSSRVNFLTYDCSTVSEFITRLAPGGPYSQITAILRTGWLKSGPYVTHNLFSSEVISHYPPSLKLCSCSGHGYDFANIQALTARGIWFCNTPDACTEAVANTGLSLVLDSFRYLTYAQWCCRFDWMRSRELGKRAVDPAGKALGIIGLGDIGLAIARKCEAALGMEVCYSGPRRKEGSEKMLRKGARYFESVQDMIPEVDCVVVAAPYTSETHHLLSTEEFALAKKEGLRVVNVARGKMVDEEALMKAIEEEKVVGVALDVHENEPVIHERLREDWRVTLLPHIGVCSKTSWANFERMQLDNLEAFLDRGKPVTPVNSLET